MALTRIDLCSRALLKIGAQTITSFDDGTAEAEVAASLYSTVRDAALSAHPWNFATYQATLPKLASAPVADFANAFQLPVDCIRVLSAGTAGRGQGIRYKIKRRQLHTDADEVILTYISRPDELDFPPFFDMALIARWGRPSKTRRRGVPAGQADRCAGRNAAQRRRFHSAGRACVMPRVWAQKSNFSAGEISPNLLGRGDLRAYENGALRLRNVFIQPTGGVTRRHGFRFIDVGPGPGRLLAFEFNTEQVYLLLFSDQKVDVYRDGSRVADFEAPWTFDQLGQINWTQSADTLLVVHPDVPPKKITRTSESAWDLTDWSFHSKGDRLYWPHYKFAAPALTLQASGTTGSVHITASAPVFSPDHVGVRLRIGGKEVQISSVISAVVVQANVKESPLSTTATEDWTEQAFSAVRGWPVSVCFQTAFGFRNRQTFSTST